MENYGNEVADRLRKSNLNPDNLNVAEGVRRALDTAQEIVSERADIKANPIPGITRQPEPIGFFETVFKRGVHENEIAASGTRLLNALADPVFDEAIPPGYTPYTESSIIDLPEKYWNYVLDDEPRPKLLQYRRERVLDEMANEQYLASGGIPANFLGGAVGLFSSPTTYLIPWVAAPKYAAFGADLGYGLLKSVPSVLAGTAAHEAIIQGSKISPDLNEFAVNTMSDTLFGLAFVGGARSLGFGAKAADTWSARKIVNINYEGIATKVKANPKGEITGLYAEVMEGFTGVGAAQVAKAQQYLDNRAVFDGLFGYMTKAYAKTPLIGSPLIKGLTSDSLAVAKFYNRVGNESIITGSIERGLPREITAVEILRQRTNAAKQVSALISDLWVSANGVKPGFTGTVKTVIKQYQDGLNYTAHEFNTAISNVIITGEQSLSHEVNQAAKIMSEFQESLYKEWLTTRGYDPTVMPPRNAIGYFTQMHDLQALARNPKGFVETVTKALETQDRQIIEFQKPVRELEKQIATLNKQLADKNVLDPKALRRQLNRTKKSLTREKQRLNQMMRDGLVDPAILDDRLLLNTSQFETIKQARADIDLLQKRIDDSLEELPGLERLEQKAARKKIKEMQFEKESKLAELNADVKSGRYPGISEKMLGAFENELNPKFRKTYLSDFLEGISNPNREQINRAQVFANQSREKAAEAWLDSIRNMNADDVSRQIFGKITGESIPNVTQKRTLLIPQKDLLDAGYLITDPDKILGMYSKTLGRDIGLKTVLNDISPTGDMDGLVNELLTEYKDVQDLIYKKHPENTPKREKLLERAKATHDEHVAMIGNGLDAYMGHRKGSAAAIRFDNWARTFAAVTMLRNVPLLQIGELGGIVFKQRLWPFISDGIGGLVRKVQSSDARLRSRENYAHALAGVEIRLNAHVNQMFEPTSSNGIPGTFIEVVTEKAARISEKIFGTQQIAHEMQKLSADITQSRVIGDMYAMKAGKLSKADQTRLLINGINPKDFDKWISAYEGGGGFKVGAGYFSNWYNWQDLDLAAQMRRAIGNDIQGSILQAGVFDKPFWTRDAVTGLPFQFFGYTYAAFNKFTAPIVQSPDAAKFMGMAIMIGYAGLIEPMRKWEKGEKFELKTEEAFDQWIVRATLESGVLGAPVEMAANIDAFAQPPFLNRYRTDKMKRRSFAGIVAGPWGGAMQNVIDTANMFIKGDITEQGLMKARNSMPVPIPLWIDAVLTRGIKSLNLPKDRSEASAWSIWRNYFGEE